MRTINLSTRTSQPAGRDGIHEQTIADLATRSGIEAKDLIRRGRHVSPMARDWLSNLERRSVYLPI